jgi:hypothetical protein
MQGSYREDRREFVFILFLMQLVTDCPFIGAVIE